MVRSSIVEPSWDATSHGSFVDCLARCIIFDPLGQRYLLKSVVLHRSIGVEGILPKAFAYSLLLWTLISISKGIRIRSDTSTAIMDLPITALDDVTSVVELWSGIGLMSEGLLTTGANIRCKNLDGKALSVRMQRQHGAGDMVIGPFIFCTGHLALAGETSVLYRGCTVGLLGPTYGTFQRHTGLVGVRRKSTQLAYERWV